MVCIFVIIMMGQYEEEFSLNSNQIHAYANGLPHYIISHQAQLWVVILGMEQSQEQIDFSDVLQCFVLDVDFIRKINE